MTKAVTCHIAPMARLCLMVTRDSFSVWRRASRSSSTNELDGRGETILVRGMDSLEDVGSITAASESALACSLGGYWLRHTNSAVIDRRGRGNSMLDPKPSEHKQCHFEGTNDSEC